MKQLITTFVLLLAVAPLFSNNIDKIQFHAVEHASFIIQKDGLTIYVDPVGQIKNYLAYPAPQLILITHAHGDHFDKNLLEKIKTDKTIIIAPKSVTDQLGYGKTVSNGQTVSVSGITIDAIPMYNTTKERLMFHPKGAGNGYVLTIGNERVYISGDTEYIPEMRALKNIDYAFICMNLPYTMAVEQAASAVLDFKPKHVYPYHYRSKDGFSDIEKFKKLVSVDPHIDVIFLKWY